jgi:drug/metabolite transporter (DMT)-like permease
VSHAPHAAPRTAGVAALGLAVVAFSMGSTLVQLSKSHSLHISFWRMLVCIVVWGVLAAVVDGKLPSRADMRAGLVPGALFGLNITCFFWGVTRTSVPHAEFIGSMTPFLLVPAGAYFFKERINVKALAFGLVSVVGLFLVLAFNSSDKRASLQGDLIVAAAMVLWACYLLTSRQFRAGRSVATVMSAMMPPAAVVVLAMAFITGRSEVLGDFSTRSVVFILILAVITGTGAHGLIVFAQQYVPVGMISIMQVSQPAMAALWSVLFLDQSIRPIQVLGMVLVIAGLVAVTVFSRRSTPAEIAESVH